VTRHAVLGGLVLILTSLMVMSLAGHTPWDGTVLLAITATHGVHEGDVPVLGAWLLGLLGCGWLWRNPPR
jgi:hypothetical protein